MNTCSFTGHRQIKNAHSNAILPVLDQEISNAYERGCRTFLAGGAIGFDTIAAREVIKFRLTHPDVRLVLYLPCMDQDKLWSEEQREAYAHILSSADEVIYVRDAYVEGCMRERNFLLASKCDMIICYVGHSRSGAAQTMRMADSMGKEIVNIYNILEESIR